MNTKSPSIEAKNPNSLVWRNVVSRLIKSEMSKRGLKYSDLSQRLMQIGTKQSEDNLRNKINKGILGADLLLQILVVLNVRRLERDDLVDILSDLGQQID